ncbi:MAG TPA: SDR family NAD(P)-dependent oxidoreductase [Acetobacteraceae bacterium]
MRNVIVTGGSRGLGLGIARRLAGSGFRAIAIARREGDALAAARAELGDRLHFQAADLAELAVLPNLVQGLRQGFGPIYGLVNNAGIGTSGVLATMPDAAIERLIRLNVASPIMLTKYVVRSMMAAGTAAGAGRIVMISSVVGSTGYNGLSVYSATKASLLGFARSLAREVGALDITVNVVAPGFVNTEMTRELDAGHRAQIARRSALKRMPEVEDVAAAVDYLLSSGARNVTGTTLTVDAGNTA